MKNTIEKIFGKISFSEWLEILLHPVIIPMASIPAWLKSLWNSRILLWGQWSQYHGFHAHGAINSLFYRTQWININRYGRLANSPIVGLGNFPLSNWWHLSALASYFFANAGAVTTLLGTLFLIFSHLIWLQTTECIWVLVVILTFLFSSTGYIMAFVRQNYQILAWMFVPIILFGVLHNMWIIATAALILASILGLTTYVVCIYLMTIYALATSNIEILLPILPATLFAGIKFIPLIANGGIQESFKNMGKIIGLVHTKVRYKRKSMYLTKFNIYYILLCGIALGLIGYAKDEVPTLLASATLLFLINQRFLRIADDQSVILTVAIAAAVEVLSSPFKWTALLGLVIVLNFTLKPFDGGSYALPKVFAPFDVEIILKELRKFLCVPRGSKIYFAFSDPQGDYGKIFDGYRVLLEAPLVVAAEKHIHLFPDWYAVYETNYDGSPPIWGRKITEVINNMTYWKADYAIVYQEYGTTLATEWLEYFETVSELDWLSILSRQEIEELIARSTNVPSWWLIRIKKAECILTEN